MAPDFAIISVWDRLNDIAERRPAVDAQKKRGAYLAAVTNLYTWLHDCINGNREAKVQDLFAWINNEFGTNILRNEDGEISLSHLYSFIEDISKLHKQEKEILELIKKAQEGDKTARDRLVEENMGLVYSSARKYSGRGYETDHPAT